MPPELTGDAQQEATPEEVPDLDVSEEVFPERPPESAEGEAQADEANGGEQPPEAADA